MKIDFLLGNAYGIGGTIRVVFNMASALAEHHEVEIVSVNRSRAKPQMELDPRVQLTSLVDLRDDSADSGHRLTSQPSEIYDVDEPFGQTCTRLTDMRIQKYLKRTRASVVVATRIALNVYLAALGMRHQAKVGQEHLCYERYSDEQLALLNEAIPKLDAYVTVSKADAETYRRVYGGSGTPILHIPDCVPDPVTVPPSSHSRVVMAAGRLTRTKRYDLLIRAFDKVRIDHPDWVLRVYGKGPQEEKLRTLIKDRELDEHVFLMGPCVPMEPEWSRAAIAASSARSEPFGMTLVEAMSCGLPVVATDCPHGPREIIQHGYDGLLVRNEDVGALADGLSSLMDNPKLRRRMSQRAMFASQRYQPAMIVPRHEELFQTLASVLRYTGREQRHRWPLVRAR